MSHALSALRRLTAWCRRAKSTRRQFTNDSGPGALPTNLPLARYDPGVHAFTCPHCGQTLSVSAWMLIESGYHCYWSLYEPDEPGGLVTARDSEFSEDGDHTTPQLAHDSHDCYRASLVPENFQWGWD